MKKIYSIFAAGLLLASCSNDDFNGKGNEQEVAITIEMPSAIASRALNSGDNSANGAVSNLPAENVTFTAALYYGSNPDPIWTGNASTTADIHAVTFKPVLVVGETYRLVSYAQFDGVATLENQVEAFGINDEAQDAYYVSTDVVAQPVMSAVLKRPTGKLRLIAQDYDVMKAQLGKDIKSVQVTYEEPRFTTFDAKEGVWSGTATTTAYSEVKTAYSNEAADDADHTVFVDYIPVNTTTGEEHVSLTVEVTFTDDTKFTREINIDVPIKRNYLTTLIGDFFTSEMELTLVIDEVFDNSEEYNYNDLATAFELGGEYTLYNNIALPEAAVLNGKNLVLNLNGYSITTTKGSDAIVVNDGTLTINGDGYITTEDKTPGYAVFVDGANAKVIINGGTYSVGLDDVAVYGKGACNSAVYTKNGGTAIINGGKFQVVTNQTAPDEVSLTRYLINENDSNRGTITIYGGSFVKFNPANNEAEGVGTSFVADGYKAVELEAGVYTVVDEDATFAASAEELATALASDAEVIYLMAGVYDGVVYHSNGAKVIESYDVANKAIVTGKFVANSDVTFNNVNFEPSANSAVDLSQATYGKNVNRYKAIVTVNKAAAKFNNCSFVGEKGSYSANAINYWTSEQGEVLAIDNCEFDGASVYTRARADVNNSTFKNNQAALWVYATKNGSVTFKNNVSEATSYCLGFLSAGDLPNTSIAFDVQANTGFTAAYGAVPSATFATDGTITFANGSDTFTITEAGKMAQ